MAFIGYNPEGFGRLINEINNRKNGLHEILNTLPNVENSIRAAWKGADADKYLENLEELIAKTKMTIDNEYDSMARQFTGTYNAWIDKQRM